MWIDYGDVWGEGGGSSANDPVLLGMGAIVCVVIIAAKLVDWHNEKRNDRYQMDLMAARQTGGPRPTPPKIYGRNAGIFIFLAFLGWAPFVLMGRWMHWW